MMPDPPISSTGLFIAQDSSFCGLFCLHYTAEGYVDVCKDSRICWYGKLKGENNLLCAAYET